jgi:hypothetical protein
LIIDAPPSPHQFIKCLVNHKHSVAGHQDRRALRSLRRIHADDVIGVQGMNDVAFDDT